MEATATHKGPQEKKSEEAIRTCVFYQWKKNQKFQNEDKEAKSKDLSQPSVVPFLYFRL
jgi:hypothetical protein